MIYKHDNELYVPCELREANRLFTADGELAYWVSSTRDCVLLSEWVVQCYGDHHEGYHFFRAADLTILKLVPCKPAKCEFKFKLRWKDIDQISVGAWVMETNEDFGNIDFQFPDATFTARLDKTTT